MEPSLESIVEALNLCAWERQPDGSFRSVGKIPAALAERFPGITVANVRLGKDSPFLAHFIAEAEPCWSGDSNGPLSSGPWTETCPDGEVCALEATALVLDDKPFLVLELLGESHKKMSHVLQSAREGSLAFEALQRAQAALRESEARYRDLSEVLEQRVSERTAELQAEIEEHVRTQERLLKYQGELRSLAGELLIAEEKERRRIATGLHDNLGQALALAKIRLGALLQRATGQEEEELAAIRALVQESIHHTRTLTFELGSPILHELGLVPALENLTQQFPRSGDLNSRFEDDGKAKPLSANTSILLYQMVRELLHNVTKHANAQEVSVTMNAVENPSGVEVIVADDGVGFEMSPRATDRDQRGFGLFNVRERLEHLGGNVRMESTPGRGSRITLRAPFDA